MPEKTKKLEPCHRNAIYEYDKCMKRSCKKSIQKTGICEIHEKDCFQKGSESYRHCKNHIKNKPYSSQLYYRYFTVGMDESENDLHMKLFKQFYEGNGSVTTSTLLNDMAKYNNNLDEIEGVSFNKGNCFEDNPLDDNSVLVEFAIRKRDGLRDDAKGKYSIIQYPIIHESELEDYNGYTGHHPNMYIYQLSPSNVEIKSVYVLSTFNKKKLKKLQKDSQTSNGKLKNPYNVWKTTRITQNGIQCKLFQRRSKRT